MAIPELLSDVPELIREYLEERKVAGSQKQGQLAAKEEALYFH